MVAKFERFKGDPKTPKELLKEGLTNALLISSVEKEIKMKSLKQ